MFIMDYLWSKIVIVESQGYPIWSNLTWSKFYPEYCGYGLVKIVY